MSLLSLKFWTLVAFLSISSITLASQPYGENIEPLNERPWLADVEQEVGHLAHKKFLSTLYERFSDQPLWSNPMARDELETQINVISLSGISKEFEWRATVLQDARLASDWKIYDVFATDSLLALMSYNSLIAENGKRWLFGRGVDIEMPLPGFQQISQLVNDIDRKNLYPFIDALRPEPEQYWAMVKAIIGFQELEPLHWPLFNQKGLIKPGVRLKQPEALITSLMRHGVLDIPVARSLIINGDEKYGPELRAAVELFQSRHGLKADGVIGDQTRKWLNKTVNERIKILALNMERMRLWPSDRDRVIYVNIPGYEMNLWIDKKVALSSKVVVGRPSRKTPLFNAHMDSVVFNPHWNVPVKIMRKDILPKARKDLEYLKKNRYRILDGWYKSKEIPIDQIDWATYKPHTFPYRLQQAPGKKNALGLVKFNIPNNNAIYLHDTPSKSLFNEGMRAFSSGCIRVEQSNELAELVLNHSGLDSASYQRYQKSFTTKFISLKRKFDVHAIYQTAWVNAAGNVEFRDDVYKYDVAPAFEHHQLDWPPALLTQNKL
ncbi:L,D-transpeptidase family protein [Veronia pacifica]|uniref:Peptidoglycan-binding protein n=1 Tax=Veronia pacifica TaxID=1080227 RepID=A0A1C3EE09_9GAMM|nr:L,D-transpeptidase family protein [Veronia pacifica]ODA31465.1 peptidoglycan-binding protein [Veronia pacifica]